MPVAALSPGINTIFKFQILRMTQQQSLAGVSLIIARYQTLLERYARRYMQNPQMANAVAKTALKRLCEDGKLKEGPALRQLLKQEVQTAWATVDRFYADKEAAMNEGLANKHWFNNTNALL